MKFIYNLAIAIVLTIFSSACSGDDTNNSAHEDTDTFTLEDKNINEVTLPDDERDVDSL